ncbi:EpsG family protein [Weissella sp. GP1]|uniref:EpsG family protein n=1 Tax=Weissella confusa TaxID=1583 RepID=UPI0032DA3439
MIVYLSIAVASFFLLMVSLFINSHKLTNFLALLMTAVFVLIAGCRYRLGGFDYSNYAYFYKLAPSLNEINIMQIIEEDGLIGNDVGWLILNAIVKDTGLNFFGFTLIIAFMFFGSMWLTLSPKMKNPLILPMVILGFTFLDVGFIYMRQSVAIAIFLYGLPFLYGKFRNLIGYVLVIALAASVHFSAVILFILWFLVPFKWTKRGLRITLMLGAMSYVVPLIGGRLNSMFAVIGDFMGGSGGEKLADSTLRYGSTSTSVTHLILFLVLAAVVYVAFPNQGNVTPSENTYIWIFMMLLPIYSILAGSEIVVRNQFYFYMAIPLVLDAALTRLSFRSKSGVAFMVSAICIALMVKFAMNFDEGAMIPYVSFMDLGMNLTDYYRLY